MQLSARHRPGPPHLVDQPQGRQKAIVPLAPRTARAIDLAIGERCDEPIFVTGSGERLDRHGAGRIVRRVARRAGLAKKIGPHTLRHAGHRSAGCRGAFAGRAGSRLARGPAHHHEMRPGQGLPRPARHLHRRRLYRRSRPVIRPARMSTAAWRHPPAGQPRLRSVTDGLGSHARRGLVMYRVLANRPRRLCGARLVSLWRAGPGGGMAPGGRDFRLCRDWSRPGHDRRAG